MQDILFTDNNGVALNEGSSQKVIRMNEYSDTLDLSAFDEGIRTFLAN